MQILHTHIGRFDVTRGNSRPIFPVVKLAPHALRVVKLDGTSVESRDSREAIG